MEKKTIFLEIPCELIEKIDSLNSFGDRSVFITNLLEQQIRNTEKTGFFAENELRTTMSESETIKFNSGDISIVSSRGEKIGSFDINTLEGFESLTKKIEELSEDPAVQIRARSLI
jgi:hypothetical protein